MRRALTAGLVAAVVLPSTILAAAGIGPRPAALPSPPVTEPRVAFTDAEQRIQYAYVNGDPFDDGGGDIGIAAGPGGAGGGLGAGPVLPALPELDYFSFGVEQDHRYDAEASALQPFAQPGAQGDPVPSAFVSARHLPEGDVYLRFEAFDDVPAAVVRITCDAAVDSHPVLSSDGLWLAWATTRDGSWSIALAPMPEETVPDDGDWCDEVGAQARLLTGPDFDETWPAWTPDDAHLVYSSTESDPLGDLWAIDPFEEEEPEQVTSSLAAETQPTLTSTGEGTATVAFTTTEFRTDGSIALLDLALSDADPVGPVRDLYPPGAVPSVQGSEPAWGTTSSDDAWLAFTSREEDPVGDVWIAYLAQGAVEFGAMFQEPVLADLGRAESHPSWRSGFEQGELGPPVAILSFTDGPRLIDVHDARADGSGDVRVLANRTEFPPPDEPSAPPPEPLHELSPAYHPAGDELAYASENAVFDVFSWELSQILRSTPADENAGEPLPYDSGPFDAEPAWSPDGTRVAFARSPDAQGNAPTRIWVADLVAGTTTQVTFPDEESFSEDHDPVWTPDGTRLLFSRWFLDLRDDALPYVERYRVDEAQVWWVDVASPGTEQDLRQLQNWCEGLCERTVQGRAPAVSPDGTRLAVADLDDTVAVSGGADVVSARGGIGVLDVDLTTTPPTVLSATTLTGIADDGTATPSRATVDATDNPAWSPDGTEVAFSAHRAGQPQQRGIWAVSAADGTGVRVVTDTQGMQDEPAFRPWADLAVTLAAAPAPDGTTTLTVTISNAGPGLVRQAQVDVELPPGLSTTGLPGCTVAGQQLTCPVATPLPAGGAPVVLDVPLQGAATSAGPITAVVTSTSPERDVTDNTATLTPGAALGISVTVAVTPTLWVGGLPGTATFTVTNLGSQPAEDVTLTTSYPALVTTTGGDPCTSGAGVCTLGTVAPGTPRVVEATLRAADVTGPPQGGPVTGVVGTSSPDPVATDDTATAPVEVRAPELLVVPAVLRPGGVAFVDGRWFPPGEPVRLSWSPGIMSAPGPYTARPDGSFQASVPVVADTILGPRRLTGTGTSPGPLFGEVDTDLLVNPSSVAAPDFLFRR